LSTIKGDPHLPEHLQIIAVREESSRLNARHPRRAGVVQASASDDVSPPKESALRNRSPAMRARRSRTTGVDKVPAERATVFDPCPPISPAAGLVIQAFLPPSRHPSAPGALRRCTCGGMIGVPLFGIRTVRSACAKPLQRWDHALP